MLIHNLLKCKTKLQELKPPKALEEQNLRKYNAQIKPKIHAKITKAGLMQYKHR